jgi:hypothetical protein
LFASRVCPVDVPDPARSGPSGPRGFRRLYDSAPKTSCDGWFVAEPDPGES